MGGIGAGILMKDGSDRNVPNGSLKSLESISRIKFSISKFFLVGGGGGGEYDLGAISKGGAIRIDLKFSFWKN
jgi:hypothetical protein